MAKTHLRQSAKIEPVKATLQSDSILFTGLLILLALLPLIFTTLTVDQFALPKFITLQVGTLLMIAYWSISQIISSRFEFKRTNIDLLIVLFFVLILVSTIFSVNPVISFLGKYKRHNGLLTFVWYFSLFFLSANTFSNDRRIKLHLKIMVYTAAAISIYGLLQYFNIDIFKWAVANGSVAGQSISTFGNRNLLAGFLAMVLPLAFVVFLSERESKRVLVFGLLFLLIFLNLLTTFSRGAWIGGALGFLLFLVLTGDTLLQKKRRLLFLGAVFLLIFVMVFIFKFAGGAEDLERRFVSIFQPVSASAAVRVEIWKSAVGIVAARPITGSGPSTFRLVFPRYQTLKYIQLRGRRAIADRAHNHILNMAATLGTPALMVFLAVVLVVFQQTVSLIRAGPKSEERILLSGLLCSVAAYLIHLMLTVSSIATTAWLWVLLGIICAKTSSFRTRIRYGLNLYFLRKLALITAAIIIVLAGAGLTLRIFLADVHFAKALKFYRQRNLIALTREFEQAIRLNPYKDTYRKEMGIAYFDFSRATGDKEAFKKAVAALDMARMKNPLDIENNLLLAEAYTYGGKRFDPQYFDDALDMVDRSLELKPYSSLAYYFRGEIHFLRGKTDDAIDYLERAIEIDPNFTQAKKLLEISNKKK